MSDAAPVFQVPLNGLRVLPLGGLGEIGMNCLILEWEDEIIVIDCGLLFSDLDHFGVEFVIPDFTYLIERKDKVKAIILTHGHEDHIGALSFLLKSGVRAPIHCSLFTSLLVREKFKEAGLLDRSDVHVFHMLDHIRVGRHFAFTPVSVNHSIVDAAALFIDTPAGKVIHTGDFKIDATPFYGQTLDQNIFARAGEEGVLLLLSDSTNVERCDHSLSENVIYHKFEELFATAEGLTIVAMFASNVGRMGQVMELAKKLGKKVALSGRSMSQNIGLGGEAGYLQGAESVLIPLDEIEQHDRRDVIVLSTGSQAELGSALTRVAVGEHKHIHLQRGDIVLMSSRTIPGNEKNIGRMVNNLFKQGAEVLYEAIHDIHVSGHATKPELRTMLELVKPRYFIPVHGEYRHLVHHAALAEEAGVRSENIAILTDGDVYELGPQDRFEKVGRLEDLRVLIEGRDGNDISKLVLKERRQMGETGMVFVLMVRDPDSRRIMAGPELIPKGLMSASIEAWMLEQGKEVAKKVVADYETQLAAHVPVMDLQENVRIELRRFFNQNIGKKPVVLPIVLDL